ncbi:universal stress protein [Puia dinghuensis]|uniref:Universal stress protein UspA n=1 Tax=Puia dinghuensis TaxID=1792502 RepID=A0A8J2UBQ2_9BACT|nr:universal stress protein [Puia dinghuensis]GGA94701.1 universal stress protein UspA [Puia dinghuensis]
MEKILLAMDAAKLNMKTIDFACYIARLTRSRLTGVFLEGLVGQTVSSAGNDPFGGGSGAWDSDADNPDVIRTTVESSVTEANIRRFRDACVCRETLSLIHRDRGIPLSEILSETRFADLLIVDGETSFSRSDRQIPGRFVKDVLDAAECPVLIAPYSFDAIDEIVFTYNGTASSVYAIKQFTSLFPQFHDKKVIVVNVRQDEKYSIEDQFKMKEWLKAHYDNPEFVILKGEPADQLFGYLIERKKAVVVMGAYGRSMLSRFFKPSQARLILKTINLPIFITHQ